MKPTFTDNHLNVSILKQGEVGVKDHNILHPALAITTKGVGVVTYSMVGPDLYLSHGYSPIDAKVGVGDINIVSKGKGPQEDYLGYFFDDFFLTGDYSWVAVEGDTVWIGSQSVEQTCTLEEFLSEVPDDVISLGDPLGFHVLVEGFPVGDFHATCGNTRIATFNWSSRISKLVMDDDDDDDDD